MFDLELLVSAHTQLHEFLYKRPWDAAVLIASADMIDKALPADSVLDESNPLSGILESVRFTLHPPNKKRAEFHRSRLDMVRHEVDRMRKIARSSSVFNHAAENKKIQDVYKSKKFLIVLIAEYKLFNPKPGDSE
jgi:hypothetical protein